MPLRLPQRVPDNAPGDFYVQAGLCTACCLPHGEAPELLNDLKQPFDECYFRRQPRTPAEVDQAIEAICVSEMCALRYGGTDAAVIDKLRARRAAAQCDQTPEGQAWLDALTRPSVTPPDASDTTAREPLAYFSPPRQEPGSALLRGLHRARKVVGWVSLPTFIFALFHLSDRDRLHFPATAALVGCLVVHVWIDLVVWVIEFREPRQAPSRRR
jgi:hypothetical protein